MGRVMVICPNTGHAVPTGMNMSAESFAKSTLTENSFSPCPACGAQHSWNKDVAWVDTKKPRESRPRIAVMPNATDGPRRSSAEVLDAPTIYLDLMSEIKLRIQVIDRSWHRELAEPMFVHDFFAIEFAIHQLRMICELVALACLAAHDGVAETRSKVFKKAYSASRIFHDLEKLQPDFYPEPVEAVRDEKLGTIDYRHRTDDVMTKSDLEKLYEYCNEQLHRARFKDVLSGNHRVYDAAYIRDSAIRIARLLDMHIIKVAAPERLIIVTMHNYAGNVRWDELERRD
jgi:hypothetical protein